MAVARLPLSKAPVAVLAAVVTSFAGVVGFTSPSPVAAKTFTIEATDTGNYSDSEFYPPDPASSEYITGYYDLLDPSNPNKEIDVIFRDFFVFDLPAAPDGRTLKGATMRALNYEVNNGMYAEQSVSIHGVLGSIDDLVNGSSSFAKLGQGPSYSSVSFDGSEQPDSFSSYTFDAAGVALVNAALGGQIAFSGRNSLEEGGGVEGVYVYRNSEHSAQNPSVFLDLQYEDEGPAVPGPLPLFGAGAAWSWSRRLRAQNRMRGSSRATSRSTATVISTTSAATTTTMP
jgi:hypothetical protein